MCILVIICSSVSNERCRQESQVLFASSRAVVVKTIDVAIKVLMLVIIDFYCQLKKSVPISPYYFKASHRLKAMVLGQIRTYDLGLVYSIMDEGVSLEQSTERAFYGDANEFAVD